MTTYNYSLSSDFGGNIRMDQFHKEIDNEGSITPNIVGINLTGDNVEITFNSGLSAGEITTLDGLISSHTPITRASSVSNIVIENPFIDLTIYSTIAVFIFPGTNDITQLTNFKIIGFIDVGTSCDIKIFDSTNKNTIATTNFSNTDETIVDLGTISNLPAEESIFELQAKINGVTIAYIKSFCFYHN